MKNIVLIGFMGTGKSSIGKSLATRLGRAFLDIDQTIETAEQMRIADIFAVHGEEYFRACEKKACAAAAARKHLVIATGGGTVKDPENLTVLRKSGLIICLTANVDTILERTRRLGQRPLLDSQGADKVSRREGIAKMLAQRQRFYAQADYTVDTSDKTPLVVINDLMRHLKTRKI